LERAVMLADHDVLTLADFTEHARDEDDARWLDDATSREWTLADVERRYVDRVLTRYDGNKTKAARALGIDRTTLWRKLQG
ncbi:MAG: sigma-54-dependent Fis family transcriptional regulator, partial [Myxococcales bacterium]|nr:sigma-54-dependent Fis family transcriptional regulator [Myxococcales bacterium]